jgi:hypothetical protein
MQLSTALIVLTGAVVTAAPTYAAIVKLSDASAVSALMQKAHSLSSDISQTGQSIGDNASPRDGAAQLDATSNVLICLLRLRAATDDLGGYLNAAALTLLLASDLKDQRDDVSALQVVRLSLSQILRAVPVDRQITNTVAGACPNSAAVNVKAQTILDLIGEIDSKIAPIARKVGATQ